MEGLIVHVKKESNLRISVVEKDGTRLIKGYCCGKDCKVCPLLSTGETLRNTKEFCSKLKEKDLMISIKINTTPPEEVYFS